MRRAFTLIEMMVVCAVLGMISALVLPNLVAMKASRERNAIYGDILRLAQMGREVAIQSGHTYSLRLGSSGSSVSLQEEADPQTNSTNTNAIPNNNGNGGQPVRIPLPSGTIVSTPSTQSSAPTGLSDELNTASVDFPSGVITGELSVGGKASNTSDFLVHFYPDGQSEGGGFEMIDSSTTRTLFIDRNGVAALSEGKLPPMSEQSWEAGQYEQRASS